VREGVPNFVSMENVPGLAKHESFRNLLKLLASLEYSVDHGVIDFHRYGVPQRRRRLVLIASRCEPAVLPKPIDNTTVVADFIADLPPLEPGETALEDLAHTTLPLSPINLERIRQSKPGGTWKDWNDSLISPCHTRAHYPASYGRMEWNKPAPTITTQFCYYSTGRFGHPTQNRTLSVREAALLQTFPADYALIDPDAAVPIRNLARHIGNAVPVKIGECIGSAMRRVSNHA